MSTLNREEALALGQRLCDASRADETEVTIDAQRGSFVRFADEGPTQSAERERVDVSIRVRLGSPESGYREARASTGADWESAQAALASALELAEASPVVEGLAPLGGAASVPDTHWDEGTLAHDSAEKARWVQAAVGACQERGLQPAGLIQTGGNERTLVNSVGRAVQGASNRASLALTATGATGSGLGHVLRPVVGRLDPEPAIRVAVEKALAAQAPSDIEPGEYTVILEPAAVSSLLLFASYNGFGAREVEEESSFLCGRLGQRVFPESVSIVDDAADPLFPAIPFDGEGTPKARMELIERGLCTRPVTDRNYARKRGEESTGHGVMQPSPSGPKARHLGMGAGDSSLEELIAGVDDGLLITQFHYTNVIEPRELVLTGMTRNGTYRIQKGELGPAVKNLRFTQSLVGALQNVAAVGSQREAVGALFDGESVVPALRIDGFRFTSTTDF